MSPAGMKVLPLPVISKRGPFRRAPDRILLGLRLSY